MSIIKDAFFGGAEKKAARASQEGIERGLAAQKAATEKATGQLMSLFPAAQQNAQMGFQRQLDILGQALPQQIGAGIQGNVGAQNALLAGLPQQQAAILGGNIDYSALRPFQMQQPDLSFLQQQLPEFTSASQAIQQNQPQDIPNQNIGVGNILGSGLFRGRY